MKLVIWDWNGTIVNDAPFIWGLFNQVIEEAECAPVSLERYRELYRHPIIDMYEEAGVNFARYPYQQLAARWHELFIAHATPPALHHDTEETLRHLAQRGHRQAVLSALPQPLLTNLVQHYGLGSYFEGVKGLPDDYAHSKVGAGAELLSTLGAAPHDVTIVGDSSHDAEVARELGTDCVLVARGLESAARLRRHGFPVVQCFGVLRGLRQLSD
jgi:phosphoglycolate phosphatase